MTLCSAKELEGYALESRDGTIGRIEAFYFDDQQWAIRYAAVSTGTWLSGRSVLLSPVSFGPLDRGLGRILVNLTRDQIKKAPGAETDKPVSRQYETKLFDYYGWPYYWGGSGMWGYWAYPGALAAANHERLKAQTAAVQSVIRREASGNAHLRSTEAVRKYEIEAIDGRLGNAVDFLIDDDAWAIRYLVVDTTTWWPGGRVLISREWIRDIRWSDSTISVDLTRSAIKKAPAYDPHLLDRPYELRLHGHYGRLGYWQQIEERAQRKGR